jgi:hypothetical protein
MDQLVQIAGAVLILIAFGASQAGAMSAHSRIYLVLNLVGSAVLTGVALHESDWGFFLLEFVWAIVSLWSLYLVLRGRSPAASH